jgi:hypothetical protein
MLIFFFSQGGRSDGQEQEENGHVSLHGKTIARWGRGVSVRVAVILTAAAASQAKRWDRSG